MNIFLGFCEEVECLWKIDFEIYIVLEIFDIRMICVYMFYDNRLLELIFVILIRWEKCWELEELFCW